MPVTQPTRKGAKTMPKALAFDARVDSILGDLQVVPDGTKKRTPFGGTPFGGTPFGGKPSGTLESRPEDRTGVIIKLIDFIQKM